MSPFDSWTHSPRMVLNHVWIRRASSDGDARLVAQLLLTSFAEYRHLYTSRAFAATTITTSEVQERFKEGPIWIASLENQPVGTVSAVKRSNDLYVRSLVVAPPARGHDIGTVLLRQVERFAIAVGCRRLVLSTTPFLTRAIRLYERYGFARAFEGPSELFGTPLFTMVLDVRPPT